MTSINIEKMLWSKGVDRSLSDIRRMEEHVPYGNIPWEKFPIKNRDFKMMVDKYIIEIFDEDVLLCRYKYNSNFWGRSFDMFDVVDVIGFTDMCDVYLNDFKHDVMLTLNRLVEEYN